MIAVIDSFAAKPIPVVLRRLSTSKARQMKIDATNPLAAEPLIDLRRLGIAGDNYYARTDGSNPPYGRPIDGAIPDLLARKSVGERLVAVNRLLGAADLEVYVVDAYRPISCQKGIWDFFWRKFHDERPTRPASELERLVSRYVSNPHGVDPAACSASPPHSTGGAIDLTLRRRSSGATIDMGTHIDDARPVSHTDYFERLAARGKIGANDLRLVNRRRLYWSMISTGFTNYNYEYWHYDYGNQMYALNMRSNNQSISAFYGYIEP
jgi:D-alanyl-D-alanine dipeptidase